MVELESTKWYKQKLEELTNNENDENNDDTRNVPINDTSIYNIRESYELYRKHVLEPLVEICNELLETFKVELIETFRRDIDKFACRDMSLSSNDARLLEMYYQCKPKIQAINDSLMFIWKHDVFTDLIDFVIIRPKFIPDFIRVLRNNFMGLIPGIEKRLDEIADYARSLRKVKDGKRNQQGK